MRWGHVLDPALTASLTSSASSVEMSKRRLEEPVCVSVAADLPLRERSRRKSVLVPVPVAAAVSIATACVCVCSEDQGVKSEVVIEVSKRLSCSTSFLFLSF